jgi:hypothetical protein
MEEKPISIRPNGRKNRPFEKVLAFFKISE